MKTGRRALELFDAAAIQRLNADGDAVRESLNNAGIKATGMGSLVRIFFKDPSEWWQLYNAGLLTCSNGLMALSTAMSSSDIEVMTKIVIKILGREITTNRSM